MNVTHFGLAMLCASGLLLGACKEQTTTNTADGGGPGNGGVPGDGMDETDNQLAVSAAAVQSLDVIEEAMGHAVASSGERVDAVACLSGLLTGLRADVGPSVIGSGGWLLRLSDIDFRDPQPIDHLVDLDQTAADGDDLFPHASGQIRVVATPTVTNAPGSGETSGQVAYEPIVITFESVVETTNPVSGVRVSWAAGTRQTGSLVLDWERSARTSWSYTLSATKQVVDKQVTISTATDSTTGIVNADWTGSRTRSRSGTQWERSRSLSGTRSVRWTRAGGQTRTVVWDVVSPEEIYLTLDGISRGPFAWWQLVRNFGYGPVRE